MGGQAATFSVSMTSNQGSYVLNGQNALFPTITVMSAAYGSFALHGQDILFQAPFTGTPILLHAPHHDLTLLAAILSKYSQTTVFGSVDLVDENGNVLTDENGTSLSAIVSNYQSYLLHALPDDFTLNTE